MNYLLTVFSAVLMSSTSAQTVLPPNYPFNPDSDGDEFVAVSDVLMSVATYDNEFQAQPIMIDTLSLEEAIQILLQQQILNQQALIQSQQDLIEGLTNSLEGVQGFEPCLLNWTCGCPLSYQGYDYETVQIGGQCWFAENLRAESYLNGDPIPTDLTDATWSSTSQGALAKNPTSLYAFQGTTAYAIGGALYNWFAVDETRGICPSGWHVPNDLEWEELAISLGGSSEAGGKMKAVDLWNPDCFFASVDPCQLAGTNESGFNGVPAGYRNYLGEFLSLGLGGLWWSATADPQPNFRNIEFDSNDLGANSFDARSGHSVRCIRDSE